MGAALTLSMPRRPFKRCPICHFLWATLADFRQDARLLCIGHRCGISAGDPGLMMFNHSCGTTLVTEAERPRAS